MFKRILHNLIPACVMAEASDKKAEKETENGEGTDAAAKPKKPSVMESFVAGLRGALPKTDQHAQLTVLDDLSLSGVAKLIGDGKVKNLIVMTGAGVSTSAGIPDFRSPGSGLYHNLQKYDLPHPQAIFEISFFLENPEPFFDLAKQLYPGSFHPTPCHYFIRLLHEKGLLLRTYTQNIDTLEHIAGIPAEKVIEAHGSFYKSHCLGCKKEYSLEWMKEWLFADKVPRCESCEQVVKPNIVFFGEALPAKFFSSAIKDFPECDLLIVMGTSLVVQPFAGLVGRVGPNVPRLLVNRDKVGQRDILERVLGLPGLDFDDENNTRDVCWLGSCDDGCKEFAKLLGWEKDLNDLMQKEWAKLEAKDEREKVDSKDSVGEANASVDSGAESKKAESPHI